METIWWSRELAEELFAAGGSAEAIANGVALRTSGLLARWQEQLADYPDALAAERIEKAAERWGGYAPAALLTIARPDCALARMEWLVDSAQRVLAIVFALNRVHQPTRSASQPGSSRSRASPSASRSGSRRHSPSPIRAPPSRLMAELQLEPSGSRRAARTSTAHASGWPKRWPCCRDDPQRGAASARAALRRVAPGRHRRGAPHRLRLARRGGRALGRRDAPRRARHASAPERARDRDVAGGLLRERDGRLVHGARRGRGARDGRVDARRVSRAASRGSSAAR